MSMEEFHKVRRLPPYVFEQVNRLKADARAAGRDIIDLGMGNPDLPTPTAHRRQAGRNGARSANASLFVFEGHSGPAQGAGAYYARRFGVKLNPGHPGHRDARLQGRLRQHGAGDHRAGRRDPGARTRPIRSMRSASSCPGGVIRSMPVAHR
jgi:hypothetical protein